MKPLHFMVAEALGWTKVIRMDDGWECGIPPGGVNYRLLGRDLGKHVAVPQYDTDWAATGPLVERFEISIMREKWKNDWGWTVQMLVHNNPKIRSRTYSTLPGETLLQGICKIIVNAHEAGQLKETA